MVSKLSKLSSNSLWGATSAQTLGFAYDALGRQLNETGPVRTVSSGWDAAGRRQYVVADGHYAIRFAWLVTGELSALQNGSFDPVVTFAYDQAGRRTATAAFDATASSRSYDAVGRLTGLALDLPSSGNDVTFGYSYNPAGEIVTNTRSNDAYSFTLANANVASTANGLNQLTAVGGASVTHDGNGNVSAIGAAGYGYDSENRLVSAPGGTALAYDPLGRLYSLSAGGTTRLFLYDGDNLFGEYATNGAPLMFYEHGPGVDEPVMSFNYTTYEFGTFHGDERGSVVAAVTPGGTSINRYDDYGNPQGGSISGRFGYTGQAWLQQAGLYHYRARAYNPAIGRFMQADPIGYGGGMNFYAYVGNNPVNFSDPTGLQDDDNEVTVTAPCPRGATQTTNGGCTQKNLDLLDNARPSLWNRIVSFKIDGDLGEGQCTLPGGVQAAWSGSQLTLSGNIEFLRSPTGYTSKSDIPVGQVESLELLAIINGFWTNPNVGPYSISTQMRLGSGGVIAFVGGASGAVSSNGDVWLPDLVPRGDIQYPTRIGVIAGEFGHKLGLSADPAHPFAHADGGIMGALHRGSILPEHIKKIIVSAPDARRISMARRFHASLAGLALSLAFAPAHAAEGRAWCNAPGGRPSTDWVRLTDFELIPISRNQRQRAVNRLAGRTVEPISGQTARRLTGSGRRSWQGNLFLIRTGVQLPPGTSFEGVNTWFSNPHSLELHWSEQSRTVAIIAVSALHVRPEQYNAAFVLRTNVRPLYVDVKCTSTVHPEPGSR